MRHAGSVIFELADAVLAGADVGGGVGAQGGVQMGAGDADAEV